MTDNIPLRQAVFLYQTPSLGDVPAFKVVRLGDDEYWSKKYIAATGVCYAPRLKYSDQELFDETIKDLWNAVLCGVPPKLIHSAMQCVPEYVDGFGSHDDAVFT